MRSGDGDGACGAWDAQGVEDGAYSVPEGVDRAALGAVGGHRLGDGPAAEADGLAGADLAEGGQSGGGHDREHGVAGGDPAAAVQDEEFVARGDLDGSDGDAA